MQSALWFWHLLSKRQNHKGRLRKFLWPSQKSWTLALVSFGWQSIIKNSELLETFKNIYCDSLMQLLSLNCTWLYFKYCSSIVKSFWHVYLICPIFLMHLIFCNALLQQFSLEGPWISLFTRILDFQTFWCFISILVHQQF